MHPVSPVIQGENFKERKIAEHQDEYMTLPVLDVGETVILSRWELSDDEIKTVNEFGKIYIFMLTFGGEAMPLVVKFEKPEFPLVIDGYKPLPALPWGKDYLLAQINVNDEGKQLITQSRSIYIFMVTKGKPIMPLRIQVEEPEFPIPEMMVMPRFTIELVEIAHKSNLDISYVRCLPCHTKVICTETSKLMIEKNPEIQIICSVCFEELKELNSDLAGFYLPETMAEFEKIKDIISTNN